MMKTALGLSFLLAVSSLLADEITLESRIKITGEVLSRANISAVAQLNHGQFLLICGDEGREIQLLRRVAEDEYAVADNLQLVPTGAGRELDLEGIAVSGNRIYAVGSHALVRPKLKEAENTRALNRELLQATERHPLRDGVFEIRMNKPGEPTAIQTRSLRQRINDDPILGPFAQIPSKENGVDIEGIAAAGDKLFVGFRGPVLREGYVPVLIFDFDKPNKADLVFLSLGGRGIRDLVRVSDGFLVIGGPIGDDSQKFKLFHWTGRDGVPGSDVQIDEPRSLGVIPLPDEDAKPEGITVLEETASHYHALIVFDGVKNGGPTRFRIKK